MLPKLLQIVTVLVLAVGVVCFLAMFKAENKMMYRDAYKQARNVSVCAFVLCGLCLYAMSHALPELHSILAFIMLTVGATYAYRAYRHKQQIPA